MPWATPQHQPFPSHKTHRASTDGQWYSGSRWRKVRLRYLRLHPLCADPYGTHREAGETVPATEVHHLVRRKDAPDLAYSMANLQGLCKSCHSRATGKEGK